jgi:hypothetical protein
MKKIVLSIAACLTIVLANAQFKQGTMLIGGSFGVSSVTDKNKTDNVTVVNGRTTSISLSPQFGYFVIDNLAVGGNLDLALSKYKQKAGSEFNSTGSQFSFGPFVRYYFSPGIFVHGAFGLGAARNKYTSVSNSGNQKYGLASYTLAVGYAYFLKDNVAIEPMIGFTSNTRKLNGTDQKIIDSSLFLRVGFQIYLRK